MTTALADSPTREVREVGAKAAALSEAMLQGLPVPPGVVVAPDEEPRLATIRAALGMGPYAVRSSSPSEDGGDHSWAGLFESRIPVTYHELAAAIEAVRTSGSSERARAFGSDGSPIPVLVQPVVPAVASGIAFSLDPRDGDERYCVVEAVRGLATDLADGTTTPARWRIRIATGASDLPAGDPLTPEALEEVVGLVRDAAAWLGRPCDVEWAWDGERVWLVQARPITAGAWSPAPGQWTSANIRENVPGVVSPLGASVNYVDAWPLNIDGTLRRVGILGDDERLAEVARFYGHLYWRVDTIKDRLLRLPGFVERSFDDTVGIEPSYEGLGRCSPLTARTLATGARAAGTIVRGYMTEGKLAQRHAAAVRRAEPGWLALDWDALNDGELRTRLAAARELHRQTAHHHFTVSFAAEHAQDALRGLAERAAARADGEVDQRLLLSGVGRVATAAAADALAALAERHIYSRDAILAADRVDELPRTVAAGFHAVIDEYGWMAPADDELAHPRWDEDPELALTLFKAAARAAGSTRRESGEALAARRREQERRVLAAAGLMRPALSAALRLARRYQLVREEMRVTWARANRIVRRAYVAQSRRWVDDRILDAVDDVFWLTPGDVDRLLAGEIRAPEVRSLVTARRTHAHRFRNWDAPTVLGAEPGSDAAATGTADDELCGVACSSGVASGPVAILRRLEDVAAVDPGSILVIKHASPGWTPAFLVAGGLIVEEGGLLSHSSVVAREHGLPAVINVAHATTALRDGERVEVDGRLGRVALLDR